MKNISIPRIQVMLLLLLDSALIDNLPQGRLLTCGGSIQEFFSRVVPSASAYESFDAPMAFSAYSPTAEQSIQKCADLVRDVIILVPDCLC